MKQYLLGLTVFLAATAAHAQSTPSMGYLYKVDTALPGKTVYVCGQRPYNNRGQLVGRGSVAQQAQQVFANLNAALSEVGLTMDNVQQVTYHLKSERGLANAQTQEQVVGLGKTFFTRVAPALTETRSLEKIADDEVLLEIEVIAAK